MEGIVTGIGSGGIVDGVRSSAKAPAPADAVTNAAAVTQSAPAETTSITDRLSGRESQTDPVLGIVTQYLDSSGNIISELPSAAAQMYLRMGLTRSGRQPESLLVESMA